MATKTVTVEMSRGDAVFIEQLLMNQHLEMSTRLNGRHGEMYAEWVERTKRVADAIFGARIATTEF